MRQRRKEVHKVWKRERGDKAFEKRKGKGKMNENGKKVKVTKMSSHVKKVTGKIAYSNYFMKRATVT